MSSRHAICLVVDGLRASALGTYGNTAYPTPQLDTFASRAVVADWLLGDSPWLKDFYRSVWSRKHLLRPLLEDESEVTLSQLQQAGVRQFLMSDESWLVEQAGQLPFADVQFLENISEQSAEQIEDTAMGRFFSATIEQLDQWREDVADASSVTWLHCQGLAGAWDAPLELRYEYLDDEDPDAIDSVELPTALSNVDDPDLLLQYRVAYAAQVAVLDACVGAFVAAIEEIFPQEETLVMLAGSRGFALGEHGSVGVDGSSEQLYSERVHLPWLIHPCGNETPLPRLTSFANAADIGLTLLDWLQVDGARGKCDGISCLPLLSGDTCPSRQLLVSGGALGERAIRTPAWMLRQKPAEGDDPVDEPTIELYSKPDDRWEYNDVADRCPDVIEQLTEELAKYELAGLSGKPLPQAL